MCGTTDGVRQVPRGRSEVFLRRVYGVSTSYMAQANAGTPHLCESELDLRAVCRLARLLDGLGKDTRATEVRLRERRVSNPEMPDMPD